MSAQQQTRYLGSKLWIDGAGDFWARLTLPDGSRGPLLFFRANELDWSHYPPLLGLQCLLIAPRECAGGYHTVLQLRSASDDPDN